MKTERGDETQFTTKIDGKTSQGSSYLVLQNFIPSYAFDALLCRNWPFSAPNRLTLQITLMHKQSSQNLNQEPEWVVTSPLLNFFKGRNSEKIMRIMPECTTPSQPRPH